jgi:hypothetical protein
MEEFERQQTALERRVERLVGRRLVRVHYYELRYEDGQPGYRRGPLDELDFGFELLVEPAASFHVTWDDEFFSHGLTVRPGSLGENLLDPAVWDVTRGGGWGTLVGSRITGANLYWLPVPAEPGQPNNPSASIDSHRRYPQDLVLEFETGPSLYASAAQYDPDRDALSGGYDGLVVLFGEELARRYGLGSHRADSAPRPG